MNVDNLRKLVRFSRLYGPLRTVFKVAGRLRSRLKIPRIFRPRNKTVSIIGCGQHAFSTIGYFLYLRGRQGISACYDVDGESAASLARFYGIENIATNASEIFADESSTVVYVISNHASHAPYAIDALDAGKNVFVEKPIAVTTEQLQSLVAAVRSAKGTPYAGYNRPFSSAIRHLKDSCTDVQLPLTLTCVVSGHDIPAEHWYRKPEEGTRVCGNVGHWIDLMVHVLHWGEMPDRWSIGLAFADNSIRDDNFSISLTSERGDLVNIILTSRAEPFEGINESISLQWGKCIAKIDDFRTMTVWNGTKVARSRFWPKDVGHKHAALQPFSDDELSREWHEVELSTLLMLKVKDMVVSGTTQSEFDFRASWSKLLDGVG